MVSESAATSVAMLEERIAKIPDEVSRAVASAQSVVAPGARRWLTTGVGASEGPARVLVSLLSGAGVCAEYRPLSAFAIDRLPDADVCVLFSQNLSPNARLAFRARARFRDMWLVSTLGLGEPLAAALERRRIRLISHGPREESGLLLRVIGPAAASVVAARIAIEAIRERGEPTPRWARDLARLSDTIAHAPRPVAPAHARVVLVSAGEDPRGLEGLRLKLVEGLGRGAVVVDVCAVVHGPLQSFWPEPATVITLEHESDPARDLFDRLGQVLPSHHQLVRLRAASPPPLAYFEHAAMLDHLVVAGLRAEPRNLFEWPGKGKDAALYDVGRDVLEEP